MPLRHEAAFSSKCFLAAKRLLNGASSAKKRRSVYRCVGIAGYPDTGPERVWGKWDLGVIVSQTVTWR